jgi:hypothetical protein
MSVTWLSGATVTFDDAPLGPLDPYQYKGLVFSGSAAVYADTKINHALGFTKTLSVSFDSPQQYVKIWIGNPIGVASQQVALHAYTSYKAATPAASVFTTVEAGGLTVPLEVNRMLSGDIVAVRIEAADLCLDNLEYSGSASTATRTLITFNDLDLFHQTIGTQYPGVSFDTTEANAAYVDNGGTDTASPPYALVSHAGEVSNPGFVNFWLDPPQGAVRLRVGSRYAQGEVQVTMRAYWLYNNFPLMLLMPIATNQVTLQGASAITNVLEIDNWTARNIAYVEVECSHNLWEEIDDLEFAPNDPTPSTDTVAPVVTQFTVNGQTTPLSLWRSATSTNVSVSGSVSENQALRSVIVCVQNPGSTTVVSNAAIVTAGEGGSYTFSFSPATIAPGLNHIWAVAIDQAGLVSAPSPVIQVTYDYPNSSVASVSPVTGHSALVIRELSAYPWPDSQPIGIPGAGTRVTIQGANLHDQIQVWMHAGGVVHLQLPIADRAPDMSSISVDIPESVLSGTSGYYWDFQVLDSWPGNAHYIHTGSYTVQSAADLPYPALYGFNFANEADSPSWGEVFGAFGNEIYNGFPFCGRTYLSQWIWYPVYEEIMSSMTSAGSCVGMSATSLLFRNHFLDTMTFNPRVHYPVGLRGPDRPGIYNFPDCAPGYPVNLWATIRSCHAAQFCAEAVDALLDQAEDLSTSSITGNPMARLEQVRADPTAYVLSMAPAIGTGHAVAPYAVRGNRIYVYDPNRPYNWDLPPTDPANVAATNSYIDIDPVSNTFSFPNLRWQGNGLFALPLDIWYRERHLPGIFSQGGRALWLLVFGSADAQISTPDGSKSLGWSKEGKLTDNLPGTLAMNLLNGTDPARRVAFLVPTNYWALNVQANVRSNSSYGLIASYGGRVLQCQALDALQGEDALFNLGSAENQLASLRVTSPRDGVRLIPRLGVTDPKTKIESLFQFGGLALPGKGSVTVRFSPAPRSVEFLNAAGVSLHPTLVYQSNENPKEPTSLSFGPLSLDPGATYRGMVTDPASGPVTLLVEVDRDGSGKFVPDAVYPGLDTRSAVGSGPDCNKNGVVDSVDIALGTSRDLNLDGLPDECQPPSAAPRLEGWFVKNNLLTFALKGEPGITYVIEASEDLMKWLPVYTNSSPQGVFQYTEPTPQKPGGARFYRAVQSP